jgi:hypothetical protein
MADNYEAVRKEVTSEFLVDFKNHCVMPRLLKRNFETYFKEQGRRIGASLDIRTAIRTIGADGQALQPEGIVRVTVPLSINYWNQEAIVYNDTEDALFLDEDKKKSYVRPHAINLANKVDRYMMQYMASVIPNWIGTPGTVPVGSAGVVPTAYQSAQTKLNQLLAETSDRSIVYNSAFNQNVVSANATLFHPEDIVKNAYLKGKQGQYADFDFMVDEQTPVGTVGTYAGSGVVNGGNQVGSNILTNSWTAGSLALSQTPGWVDRVTFAGCYEINYQSRLQTANVLKQFAVVSPVVDTAGAATLNIFPAIVPSGPYQNCTASPTTGGGVTIAGASGTLAQVAFAFQEGAFTWVPIELQNVSRFGANCTVITDAETGISIRCTEQWDNRAGEVTMRMDFIWGIASTECDHKAVVIYG